MDTRVQSWAASGAMALTGHPTGPALGPPAPLVDAIGAASDSLRSASHRLGTEVVVDGLALLGERAALRNLTRRGSVSCGGGTRLLDAADGLVAVALVRADDLAAIPAWLEIDAVDDDDPWAMVTDAVRTRPVATLVARADLLGLAVAARPDRLPIPDPPHDPWPLRRHPFGPAGPAGPIRELGDVLVVDLSALWAGPLCGQLLAAAGARVVKVESATRPDGARVGDPALFALLNELKRSVALDLTHAAGRRILAELLRAADVVIESSRPRALEQMGIRADDLLADPDGPTTWISITGYGRAGPDRNRIAYGDVAAVAAGLVADDDTHGPCFYADAVADPITGLVAATGALEALESGRCQLLDVALARVAGRCAGPALVPPAGDALAAAPPRARPSTGPAPALGAHTDAVLREILR